MDKIVQFLTNNWSFISTGILLIASLITIFLKRSPRFLGLYEELSKIIYFVEKAHPDFIGKEKLNEAISLYKQTNGEVVSDKVLVRCIENLLSLPTKKGGLGREEEATKQKS